MAITHGLRAQRVRITRSALIVTSVVALMLSFDAATPVNARGSSYYACQSTGYSCVLDGYNATTMNDNWAARYYGEDTKGGIGTPPHNCTLYAAWMLAHNGLPDPGHSWGYADQWGHALAAETNHTPAVGSIAWYAGGAMGHVAYVAQINLTNQTVFLDSDNYAGGVNGYTSNGWVPINQPTGYIHLRDQTPVASLAKKQRLPMRP
jgi:surface antigen